jgi:hypothetical protein
VCRIEQSDVENSGMGERKHNGEKGTKLNKASYWAREFTKNASEKPRDYLRSSTTAAPVLAGFFPTLLVKVRKRSF